MTERAPRFDFPKIHRILNGAYVAPVGHAATLRRSAATVLLALKRLTHTPTPTPTPTPGRCSTMQDAGGRRASGKPRSTYTARQALDQIIATPARTRATGQTFGRPLAHHIKATSRHRRAAPALTRTQPRGA